MSTLSKEEVILSSNDNSITLTTHRILQKTKDTSKEIFLKDILSHEVIRRRSKYYLLVFVIFGILSLIQYLLYLQKSSPFNDPNEGETSAIPIIPALITGFALLFYLTTIERFLKISGRFNELEFSLKRLSQDSLNKFISRMAVESDNRKKEE